MRGFYFTFGTQHGTLIDRLIGALEKKLRRRTDGRTGLFRPWQELLHRRLDLKVIIGEASWVSTDRHAVRRAQIVKAALYTFLMLVSITAAAAWWESYRRNRDLIADTQLAVAQFNQQAGPFAKETAIGDRDLHKVMPLLFKLRNLPAGFVARNVPTPMLAELGLSQRERLQTSAEQIYHVGLERLFRPRLMFRMEEVLKRTRQSRTIFMRR